MNNNTLQKMIPVALFLAAIAFLSVVLAERKAAREYREERARKVREMEGCRASWHEQPDTTKLTLEEKASLNER